MKAIQMHATGGPEVLQIAELPIPFAGTGQLLIRVVVAGVNYADIGMRMGMFHGPQSLPVTPGFEVVGTVAAVGAEVVGFTEGQRVAAVLDAGGYAEYAVADAQRAFALPDDVTFMDATALCIQGPTAHGVLYDAGQFTAGDAVLVQAAAGGVGSLAVQLAKLGGAHRDRHREHDGKTRSRHLSRCGYRHRLYPSKLGRRSARGNGWARRERAARIRWRGGGGTSIRHACSPRTHRDLRCRQWSPRVAGHDANEHARSPYQWLWWAVASPRSCRSCPRRDDRADTGVEAAYRTWSIICPCGRGGGAERDYVA